MNTFEILRLIKQAIEQSELNGEKLEVRDSAAMPNEAIYVVSKTGKIIKIEVQEI